MKLFRTGLIYGLMLTFLLHGVASATGAMSANIREIKLSDGMNQDGAFK